MSDQRSKHHRQRVNPEDVEQMREEIEKQERQRKLMDELRQVQSKKVEDPEVSELPKVSYDKPLPPTPSKQQEVSHLPQVSYDKPLPPPPPRRQREPSIDEEPLTPQQEYQRAVNDLRRVALVAQKESGVLNQDRSESITETFEQLMSDPNLDPQARKMAQMFARHVPAQVEFSNSEKESTKLSMHEKLTTVGHVKGTKDTKPVVVDDQNHVLSYPSGSHDPRSLEIMARAYDEVVNDSPKSRGAFNGATINGTLIHGSGAMQETNRYMLGLARGLEPEHQERLSTWIEEDRERVVSGYHSDKNAPKQYNKAAKEAQSLLKGKEKSKNFFGF